MSNRTTNRSFRNLLTRGVTVGVAAAILASTAGGCSGSRAGQKAHSSRAKENLSIIKAGTEWDMARQAFLAGELDKALKRVDMSLSHNANVAKSHVLRGRILLEMGRLEESLDALARGEALDPENAEAPYYQAIIYERFTQGEEALAKYQRAAEIDPQDAQYAIAASEVLIDLGRYAEAEQYLNERGEGFRHNAGVQQTLGNLAMIEGDVQRAVEHYEEAALLAPDDELILEDLTFAQMEIGQFAEAELALGNMLSNPDNDGRRDLMHLRARCLVELDRPLDARELLSKLVDGPEGQSDLEAWVGLGNVSYLLKDFRGVNRAARRITTLAPDRYEGYLLQALAQRKNGDRSEALESLARAQEVSPNSQVVLNFRTLVQFEMNMIDAAQRTLQTARAFDANSPVVAQLQGMLDAATGQNASANAATASVSDDGNY
ncbi:MAG: tetratricopeptide repeat protein [Phycisphaerales bacterium]|jgi:tetratricopeptide (TPR) repeat protein|nr:tetratricopeptide repeat protein [Phycisphaerales bacterium]